MRRWEVGDGGRRRTRRGESDGERYDMLVWVYFGLLFVFVCSEMMVVDGEDFFGAELSILY